MHLLASGIPKGTTSSLWHDLLIIAHYLFAWAFVVLGVLILFLIYRAHPAIKLWYLAVPLVLGVLATGQITQLDKWSTGLSKGASAHIGTATSDVSPGTLAILLVLVVGIFIVLRRGSESGGE